MKASFKMNKTVTFIKLSLTFIKRDLYLLYFGRPFTVFS